MFLVNNKRGFTLLEIIIVIIIVGVLASVALPRFFRLVEGSRAAEALVNLSALRHAMERCYIMKGGTYSGCGVDRTQPSEVWEQKLAIENPADSPNAHFRYITSGAGAVWTIRAERNTRDNGDDTSAITLHNLTGPDTISRQATGVFSNLNQ